MARDLESASAVPMTPDGTVIWDVTDCPEIGGSMLTAPNCTPDILTVLRKVSIARRIDPHIRVAPIIHEQPASIVYKWPNPSLALKEVVRNFYQPNAERLALQANVTLAEGLRRIMGTRQHKVRYTTPQYYGAYFPYEVNNWSLPIWVMSYEAGVPRSRLSADIRRTIPNPTKRRQVYNRALQACGGEPSAYDLDMNNANELIRVEDPLTSRHAIGGSALTIVKLDISDYFSITEIGSR